MQKSLKQTIYEMLMENTGIAMMDSGGANGRAWQRNAGKTLADFENEPDVTFDQPTVQQPYLDYVTVSTFKCLTEYAGLELDELCHEFNSTFVPSKDWNGEFYGISEAAQAWIDERFDAGEAWNTYNGESDLSQILQGTPLKEKNGVEHYILLQVHGGADARGGYTDARLFKCRYEYLNLNPTIYGDVDGVDVRFEGSQMYREDTGDLLEGDFKPDTKIHLYLYPSE